MISFNDSREDRAEAAGDAYDPDWQAFCKRIGWQQLSEPTLPDDYEDELAARIFGRGEPGDDVVPMADRLRLREVMESAEPLSLGAEPANDRHDLSLWVAAVAVATIVSAIGAAVLGRTGAAPASANVVPAPAPEVTQQATVAPPVHTPPPTESTADEDSTSSPDPGSQRARLARRDRPEPVPDSRQPRRTTKPESVEPPLELPAPIAAAEIAFHSVEAEHHLVIAPDSSLVAYAPAALDSSTPIMLPALTGIEAPAVADRATVLPPIGPKWLDLDMTAPREASGIPAGVRVIAQLDVGEVSQVLIEQL